MRQKYIRNKSVIFFAPDVTDVSTIKRADAFLDNGFHITVLGFRRTRYNRDYDPRWPYIELGRTSDGNYFQRILALLRAFFILVETRRYVQRAARFYARNIDQLLLAILSRFLFRRDAAIIYEVLDIQPAFTGTSMRSRLLRLVERLCLARVSLLVVSSPAFVRNYYEPVQAYRGNWFLLENKLHASAVPAIVAGAETPAPVDREGYKWVVNYVGLIRGQRTFDLITRLAEKFSGEILFRFHGILTTVDHQAFHDAVSRNENMRYCGDYLNPRDLALVYRDTDFVWALDLENADNNSRWLLPCRLYEAGALGLPCLAARDFEAGRKVEAMGAGWTFPEPYEETMAEFLASVTQAEVEEKRRHLATLPQSTFVAGEDTAALCLFVSDDALMSASSWHKTGRERAHRLTPEQAATATRL